MSKLIFSLLLFSFTVYGAYTNYYFTLPNGTGTLSPAEGADWTNSGNLDSLNHYSTDHIGASVRFIIRPGGAAAITMTASINTTSGDGSAAEPFIIQGVTSTCNNVGDAIVAADLPSDFDTSYSSRATFNGGTTYTIYVGDTSKVSGIGIYGEATSLLRCDAASDLINNYVHHTQATAANEFAVNISSSSSAMFNFIRADSCQALTTGNNCFVVGNYFYNCSGAVYGDGVNLAGSGNAIIANRFYNCTRGINGTNDNVLLSYGNTFSSCDTAMKRTTDRCWRAIDNIFTAGGYGYASTTANGINYYSTNCFYGNTANFLNVDSSSSNRDYRIVKTDPAMTSPFDGTIQAGSSCINTGR